jgi:hypothetical protein
MWAGIFFPSRESLNHSPAKQRGFSPLQKGKNPVCKGILLTWHGPMFLSRYDFLVCPTLTPFVDNEMWKNKQKNNATETYLAIRGCKQLFLSRNAAFRRKMAQHIYVIF